MLLPFRWTLLRARFRVSARTELEISRLSRNQRRRSLFDLSAKFNPSSHIAISCNISHTKRKREMALKATHVSDVPNLDQVRENATFLFPTRFSQVQGVVNGGKCGLEFSKFLVVGHRGSGMNMLQSCDPRMKSIKENSTLSFNAAASLPVDFIEFDIQVTRDGCPVVFHDIFITTENQGAIVERRVTDITLAEFLSYGPQKEPGKVGKPLCRKTKNGEIFEWKVEEDAPLCTLPEVFEQVHESIGFNIELKFDDHIVYKEEELKHILNVILEVASAHAKSRSIIFSSFQPGAAQLMRKLQDIYPVFFLTNGGTEIYTDQRRNSLEEAIKVCLAGGLQGIVSQAKAILRNPGAVTRIKEQKLCLITYGQLNNVPEVVYVQYLMGVQGVIVDLVKEITEAVSDIANAEEEDDDDKEERLSGEDGKRELKWKHQISKGELSHLLELIPELAQT